MVDAEQVVARLRKAYARWGETKCESVEDWVELVADDVRLRSVAQVANTCACTGKEEAARYLGSIREAWELVSLDIEEFVAQNDRVVMIGRVAYRSLATGKVAESPKIDIFRFCRETGKITEV